MTRKRFATVFLASAGAMLTALLGFSISAGNAQVKGVRLPMSVTKADGFRDPVPPQRDQRILEMFRKEYPGLAPNKRHHVHTLSNGYRILVDVNRVGQIVGWGYSNLQGKVILDPGGNLLELNPSQIAESGNTASKPTFQRQLDSKKKEIPWKCLREVALCNMGCGEFFGEAVIKSGGSILKFFGIVAKGVKKSEECQAKCLQRIKAKYPECKNLPS